jgi:hypothetical protein
MKPKQIGPVHIILDDRHAKQLKPFRDAIAAASRDKKPRGVFGQVYFSGPEMFPVLTIVCPLAKDAAEFVKAVSECRFVKRMNAKKAKP